MEACLGKRENLEVSDSRSKGGLIHLLYRIVQFMQIIERKAKKDILNDLIPELYLQSNFLVLGNSGYKDPR